MLLTWPEPVASCSIAPEATLIVPGAGETPEMTNVPAVTFVPPV